MKHYITFEDTKKGNEGWDQIFSIIDVEDVKFTNIERGGGDPPLHAEEKWMTQYFSSLTPISEEEEARLSNLPGVIDWDFNQEN